MILRPFRSVSYALATISAIALATLTIPQLVHASEHDRYIDESYGFSFAKPRFTPSEEKDLTTVAITLAGSPSGAFAPNVNVIVQNVETNLDAFAESQLQELQSIGWEVVDQSRKQIGESPALRTRARGSLRGMQIEFLAIAIIQEGKKVFVLTCTATQEQFPLLEAEFDRVASSFVVSGKYE